MKSAVKRRRGRTRSQGDGAAEEALTSDEQRIEEREHRDREQKEAQFQQLKDNAQAIFGLVAGRPGVRSPAEFKALLEKAGDDIGNGRFIVRHLGAERYLDPETVAVLIALRQNLIAETAKPTAADIMMIDAAVIAYYNLLRTQGWMGNLSLLVERELFGQRSLDETCGSTLSSRVREELGRLSEVILPLQERCQRMMARSFGTLSEGRG
jgi:hypothetical protein